MTNPTHCGFLVNGSHRSFLGYHERLNQHFSLKKRQIQYFLVCSKARLCITTAITIRSTLNPPWTAVGSLKKALNGEIKMPTQHIDQIESSDSFGTWWIICFLFNIPPCVFTGFCTHSHHMILSQSGIAIDKSMYYLISWKLVFKWYLEWFHLRFFYVLSTHINFWYHHQGHTALLLLYHVMCKLGNWA